MEQKVFKRAPLPVIVMECREGKISTPRGDLRLLLKDAASGKIYRIRRTPGGGLQMTATEST